MITMPNLDGPTRELALYRVQDALRILSEVEEMLCLTEDEEEISTQVSQPQE